MQADYRAVGYAGGPPPPPEQIGPRHLPAATGAFFAEVASRRYPFQRTYSAQDYLAILASQSGTHSARAAAPTSSPRYTTGWSRWAGPS